MQILGRLIAVLAIVIAGVSMAKAQTVELKFVGFAPPKSGSELIPNWWMDEIESRTKGAVKFRRFPAGTLCKGQDIVDCVKDGRADAGSTPPAYTPAYFPISALDGLPFISSDQVAVTKGFAKLYTTSPEYRAEHEKLGLRLQVLWAADPLLIGTKFDANDLTVFSGKRIRAVGIGVSSFVAALGAQPVAVAAAEQYEALQTGVLAGFTNTFEGSTTWKLSEVSTHWYDPGFGIYATVGLWISNRAWQRLSPENQKIVEQVTQELVNGKAIELYDVPLKGTCDALKASAKIKVFKKWDPALTTQVREKTGDRPYQAWADNAKKAGVANPKAIYDMYVAAVKAAESKAPTIADACIASFK